MTAKQLLLPRYEVIADYPDSKFEIGDILYEYKYQTSVTGMYCYVTNLKNMLNGKSLKKESVESNPHLFKKLNWWEKRKEEEMPKKLTFIDNPDEVYDIEKWDMELLFGFIDYKNRSGCDLTCWGNGYMYLPID